MLHVFLKDQNLTVTEFRVLTKVLEGGSNRDIASKMGVGEKTIKFHLTNIYKKVNVASRAQLIVKCLSHYARILS